MAARRIALLSLVLLAAACFGGKKPPPRAPQWRPLEPAELAQPWRDESKERYARAEGDFDGDGKTDHAFFLASADGARVAVSALLAGSPDAHVLVELGKDELPAYGVRHVARGEYRTFCGRSGECAPGEPARVTVAHDGLEVFQHEGPVVMFVWDPEKKTFARHWISD